MRKILFFTIISLGAVMVSCCKSAEVTEEKAEIAKPASRALSAIRTANELAKYGYEVESASALVEAANILVSVPTQEMDVEAEVGEKTDNEVAKTSEKSLCPKALLAEAKEFAMDDEVILGMIAKVEAKLTAQAEATRGAMGGPKYAYGKVYAKNYTYYYQKFWADEIAEVAVSGDGDTDLDLYVYDENGNLIASDTDYTDDCYVRFAPRWTGTFAIKIVNRGNVFNNYAIVTN